jgi:hypothetical protein
MISRHHDGIARILLGEESVEVAEEVLLGPLGSEQK